MSDDGNVMFPAEQRRPVGVHKAEPIGDELHGISTCLHCEVMIHLVPGGQGPTWVHADTGAVAAGGSGPSPVVGVNATQLARAVDHLREYADTRDATLVGQERDVRAVADYLWSRLPRVRTIDAHTGEPYDEVLRTKLGRVLTEKDIALFAEEAEKGYSVPQVVHHRDPG